MDSVVPVSDVAYGTLVKALIRPFQIYTLLRINGTLTIVCLQLIWLFQFPIYELFAVVRICSIENRTFLSRVGSMLYST